MKHREFVYIGEPVWELKEQEYAAFFVNVKKSILLSLVKRNLLTDFQYDRCLGEVEKQYNQTNSRNSSH